MKRAVSFACVLAGLLAAANPAQAATIVNIDGTANASLDGANGASFSLGAGTYRFSFVQAAYTAFSRFSNSGGCDAAGGNCSQGFENSARILLDGKTILLGDGNASGGIGPVSGGGYFDTAATSLANAVKYSTRVTLLAPATGSAFLYDDYLDDNRGGVSLSISAVPEPATWGLMILGFGAIGGALRYRRTTKVAFA